MSACWSSTAGCLQEAFDAAIQQAAAKQAKEQAKQEKTSRYSRQGSKKQIVSRRSKGGVGDMCRGQAGRRH